MRTDNHAGANLNTIHDTPQKLAALLERERDTLMSSWRSKVRELPSASTMDTPALNDHMPTFIDDLAAVLAAGCDRTAPDAVNSGKPSAHGVQRAEEGFNIEEVVAEYGALRGCIQDLAELHRVSVQGSSFRILNVVLDGAIGVAVQTYASQRALEAKKRRDEHLAFIAHDLRTPLNAISLAAHVLERTVPMHEANPAQLQLFNALRRNVEHLDRLVHTVLEENSGGGDHGGLALERRAFDLWPLVEAIIHEFRPIADRSGTLLANAIPDDLVVFADAHMLRRVFHNLLADAIARTPRGKVSLSAREIGDHGAECWISNNMTSTATPEERLAATPDTPPAHSVHLDHDEPTPGLAIVKTLVEAHGGELVTGDMESSGPAFRFNLPARQPTGDR